MNTEHTNYFYILNLSSNGQKTFNLFVDANFESAISIAILNWKEILNKKPLWLSVRTNEMFYGRFNKIKLVNVLI